MLVIFINIMCQRHTTIVTNDKGSVAILKAQFVVRTISELFIFTFRGVKISVAEALDEALGSSRAVLWLYDNAWTVRLLYRDDPSLVHAVLHSETSVQVDRSVTAKVGESRSLLVASAWLLGDITRADFTAQQFPHCCMCISNRR